TAAGALRRARVSRAAEGVAIRGIARAAAERAAVALVGCAAAHCAAVAGVGCAAAIRRIRLARVAEVRRALATGAAVRVSLRAGAGGAIEVCGVRVSGWIAAIEASGRTAARVELTLHVSDAFARDLLSPLLGAAAEGLARGRSRARGLVEALSGS